MARSRLALTVSSVGRACPDHSCSHAGSATSKRRMTRWQPASTRRMVSCGCRNRCVSLCRHVRLVWELNDDAIAFTAAAGGSPGEANPRRFRGLGQLAYPERQQVFRRFASSLRVAAYRTFAALPMPNVADHPLRPACCCFPYASPDSARESGKQKTDPKDRPNSLEGIWSGRRDLNPRPQPWQARSQGITS